MQLYGVFFALPTLLPPLPACQRHFSEKKYQESKWREQKDPDSFDSLAKLFIGTTNPG